MMSLFACTSLPPMSPFVANFGYSPPPHSGNVIFEWPQLHFDKSIFAFFESTWTIKVMFPGYFSWFYLRQQLCRILTFWVEKRLHNILWTTNATKFIEPFWKTLTTFYQEKVKIKTPQWLAGFDSRCAWSKYVPNA